MHSSSPIQHKPVTALACRDWKEGLAPHVECHSLIKNGDSPRPGLKTVMLSVLKANCIAILREAQQTAEPIVVTRRGRMRIKGACPIIQVFTEEELLYRRPMPCSAELGRGS